MIALDVAITVPTGLSRAAEYGPEGLSGNDAGLTTTETAPAGALHNNALAKSAKTPRTRAILSKTARPSPVRLLI
ncbi:hypothetical protein [Sphingomonas sp. NFR15]|uniref:hypothetical protein n=1 Tax=Sphingomonas sp. NFR15 TaxID=1566282 RepID=UPI0015A2D77C|nr:hypothetical protein [Sphingomonas sp. NFR15]